MSNIHGFDFLTVVKVHDFPAPSPPLKIMCKAKTQSALTMLWLPPTSWGGCALSTYELELRERTNKGEVKEWQSVGTTPKTDIVIHKQVYEADVRVRACNVGSTRWSEWSKVCAVKHDTTEGERKLEVDKLEAMERKANEVDGLSVETGVAVISAQGLDRLYQLNGKLFKSIVGRKRMEDENWSDFATRVGEFFLTIGVYGGICGMLFDLKAKQVEELAIGAQQNQQLEMGGALDLEKPLLSLANAAVWVLQTLAHNTEDADEWIIFMNEVSSLVVMGSSCPEDPSTEPIIEGLLFALHSIYETLRQCEDNGYVTMQLNAKYERPLKKLLKQDWMRQMERLKEEVAVPALSLVLYRRYKEHGLKAMMHDQGKRISVARSQRTPSLKQFEPSIDAAVPEADEEGS